MGTDFDYHSYDHFHSYWEFLRPSTSSIIPINTVQWPRLWILRVTFPCAELNIFSFSQWLQSSLLEHFVGVYVYPECFSWEMISSTWNSPSGLNSVRVASDDNAWRSFSTLFCGDDQGSHPRSLFPYFIDHLRTVLEVGAWITSSPLIADIPNWGLILHTRAWIHTYRATWIIQVVSFCNIF